MDGYFYENYPLESIDEFPQLIQQNPNLRGINVTIPYKEKVIPFLDELDVSAKEIKAVNVIKKRRDGSLKGYNSDVFGFKKSLLPLLKSHDNQALILGTGGASKAVEFALNGLGIKVNYVSRNPIGDQISYKDLSKSKIKATDIIVNSTPLGMSPNIDTFPNIPYKYVGSKHLLYDLVYNPEETVFLRNGIDRGARIKNGLDMLVFQADKAWEIWNENDD